MAGLENHFSKAEQHSSHNGGNEFYGIKPGEFLLFLATMGLWYATQRLVSDAREAGSKQFKLLADTAAEQSRNMQESISAAREANLLTRTSFITTQRPWIHVEVSPLGIEYNVNGLNLKARFILVNSGSSPAIHVNINPRVIAPDFSDLKRGYDPTGAIRSIITERRQAPLSPWGITIPADRNSPSIQDITVVSLSKDDLDRMTAEFDAIYPILIVVVEYRSVFETDLHFTAFGLDISRRGPPHKDGWAPNLIVPSMGDLGPNDLIFNRSYVSGEYAD